MQAIKGKALEVDLYEKIDWTNTDETYLNKWDTLLDRVADIKKKVSKGQHATLRNLADIDASTFFNWACIQDQIQKEIHEDYDLTGIEEIIASQPIDVEMKECTEHTESDPTDITVQIVDVDYEITPRGAQIFMYTRDVDSEVTRLVTVPFKDYFYVRITPMISEGLIRKKINGYLWYLCEKKYPEAYADPTRDLRKHFSRIRTGEGSPKLVTNMEVTYDLKSLYGYQPNEQRFLKVTTNYPAVTVDLYNGLSKKFTDWEFYEAKTDYINKFLTKHKLSACAPVTIRQAISKTDNIYSYCDYHVQTEEKYIESAPEDTKPYTPRYVFWDIECLSLDPDVFPDAKQGCPVIQISYLCSVGSEEIKRGVLCLKDTPGEHFECYEFEDQMLIRFAQILLEFNPDAVVGYNSNNFDFPYVIDRMKCLGIHEFASQFTRRKGLKFDYQKIVKHSNQFGSRDVYKYVSPGRLPMDQFELLKGDATKRLESYTLKHVCSVYLKDDNKEDLRYRDIPELFKTPEGRSKIASYCLKDGELLLSLEKAIMFGLNLQAMARVLGTTTDVVANRGLVHKLMGKLKQYTERFNFVIPTFTEQQKPVFEGKYQGAFVLDPDVGYHEDPVVVLDYASLYPSLMIYYNLSYDSIVFDKEWIKENPDKCETMENGVTFVTTDTHFGILPLLEQELGKQRKAAKKKKAAAPDGSVEQAIYDGEQNAVKIVMNSLYGMCGSPTATIPCVEIAASITAMGRFNLMGAKDYVESRYCEFTGQPKELNAKVVYGDTDSIFIKMPGIDVKKAMEFGKLLEVNITRDLYNKPNALVMEYEKIFCPLLLVTAKRYAGRKYEFDHTKSKLNCNGLQLVKRDSPELCKETMSGFFKRALMDSDKGAAGKFVEEQVKKLMVDEHPLTHFRLTKKISKQLKDYTVIPPHIQAWQRMIGRIGAAESPSVGEQFKFIITRVDKKQKGLAHAMVDYPYAEENKLGKDIDKIHYLRTFIDNPLRLPMKLILGKSEMERILDPNNYTRTETITAKKGNLLGFFGKTTMTKKSKRRDFTAQGITGDSKFKKQKVSK